MSKKRAFYGGITVLLMLFMLFPSRIIFVNVTASLPPGIYVSIPNTTLRQGDYVGYQPTDEVRDFSLEHGWMPGDQYLFLKKAALPGTFYQIGERFYIEGEDRGPVFKTSPSGVQLPDKHGIFVVPEGQFLPYGTNDYSFDGRYEGTVPMENIVARVIPIWIF